MRKLIAEELKPYGEGDILSSTQLFYLIGRTAWNLVVCAVVEDRLELDLMWRRVFGVVPEFRRHTDKD